ncbi:hypothetical protein PG984_012032 [Apiospora sp. TS-2023a]
MGQLLQLLLQVSAVNASNVIVPDGAHGVVIILQGRGQVRRRTVHPRVTAAAAAPATIQVTLWDAQRRRHDRIATARTVRFLFLLQRLPVLVNRIPILVHLGRVLDLDPIAAAPAPHHLELPLHVPDAGHLEQVGRDALWKAAEAGPVDVDSPKHRPRGHGALGASGLRSPSFAQVPVFLFVDGQGGRPEGLVEEDFKVKSATLGCVFDGRHASVNGVALLEEGSEVDGLPGVALYGTGALQVDELDQYEVFVLETVDGSVVGYAHAGRGAVRGMIDIDAFRGMKVTGI